MDRQEILDTVVTALIAQGVKCTNEGQCLYRGPNNTKCAVGHLVPDDEYSKAMEGDSISTKKGYSKTVYDLMEDMPTYDLICDLQTDHDGPDNNERWLNEFLVRAKETATKHNLEWRF